MTLSEAFRLAAGTEEEAILKNPGTAGLDILFAGTFFPMSVADLEELYEKGNVAGRHVVYVGGVHHVCDKAWVAVGGRGKEEGGCNPVTFDRGASEAFRISVGAPRGDDRVGGSRGGQGYHMFGAESEFIRAANSR